MIKGIGIISFAIGILFLGGWMFIQSINEVFLARQSYKWPRVTGKIINSSIFEREIASGTTFTPHIEYHYSVAGKSYEGNRIWFGANGSGKKDDAKSVIARYRVDAAVPVFFSPSDARVSCLEPGRLQSTIYGKFFISFLFLLTGLFCSLWWYINDSPKLSKTTSRSPKSTETGV